MAKSQIVEIEAVAPRNRQVIFKPIGKSIRGRIDFSDPRNKTEQHLRKLYPTPIPGQRICIDFATGEKWISEPLHLEEYEELRAVILAREFKLPPKREDFGSESVTTWVYHASKLIGAGLARVVVGELPDWETLGEKPRKSFISNERKSEEQRTRDVFEKLATATDRLCDVAEAILNRIEQKQGVAK